MLGCEPLMRPILIAILLSTAACNRPPADAAETAQAWLEATAARDAKAMHALLVPSAQARVQALYNTVNQTRKLIRDNWAPDDIAKAMKSSGLHAFRAATTPELMFEQLVAQAGVASGLTRLQRVGLRAQSSEEVGDALRVKTVGGDAVDLIKVGENWRVVMPPADQGRLEKLEAVAERNLAHVQGLVRELSSRRFGANKK